MLTRRKMFWLLAGVVVVVVGTVPAYAQNALPARVDLNSGWQLPEQREGYRGRVEQFPGPASVSLA